MKKVFISQPMKNKTDEEILAEREQAIKNVKNHLCNGGVKEEEIEFIDSFFEDAPENASPLWFLGKSIELLATADVVYFCKGWIRARGCIIEYLCAFLYGVGSILCAGEDTPDDFYDASTVMAISVLTGAINNRPKESK